MKLDFDIKTKGANLDFDMKDTKVISQSTKKEIVVANLNDMIDNQDNDLFVDLSKRYINGDIIIIGQFGKGNAFISAMADEDEGKYSWSLVSSSGTITGSQDLVETKIVVFVIENLDGYIKYGISSYPISDYVRLINMEEYVDEQVKNSKEETNESISKIENDIAIINNALNKFDETIKYDSEKKYNVRTTADDLPNGYSVIDGSKTVLKNIVGSTVKCENLLDVPEEFTWTGVYQSTITLNEDDYTISWQSYVQGGEDSPVIVLIHENGTTHAQSLMFGFSTFHLIGGRWNIIFYANGYSYNNSVNVTSTINKLMLNKGTSAKPYFTDLKSASFSGVESENAEGTKKDTFVFPKTEIPLGTTIDFESEKIIEEYAETTQDTPFTEEELAQYSDYLLSVDKKTIRYKLETPIKKPFTEEQIKASNEYRVFANGTEKVIENDGEEYGADNTITQNYIAVKVKE